MSDFNALQVIFRRSFLSSVGLCPGLFLLVIPNFFVRGYFLNLPRTEYFSPGGIRPGGICPLGFLCVYGGICPLGFIYGGRVVCSIAVLFVLVSANISSVVCPINMPEHLLYLQYASIALKYISMPYSMPLKCVPYSMPVYSCGMPVYRIFSIIYSVS